MNAAQAILAKIIEVINPATNEIIGVVPDIDESAIDLAINQAHEAFLKWRRKTGAR
ncbi:MAG: aldehyde dehydrogenase family protein [Bacteroidota bacterium]